MTHCVCRLQGWIKNPYVPVPYAGHRPSMQPDVLKEHADAGKVALLAAIRRP